MTIPSCSVPSSFRNKHSAMLWRREQTESKLVHDTYVILFTMICVRHLQNCTPGEQILYIHNSQHPRKGLCKGYNYHLHHLTLKKDGKQFRILREVAIVTKSEKTELQRPERTGVAKFKDGWWGDTESFQGGKRTLQQGKLTVFELQLSDSSVLEVITQLP